MFTAAIAVRIAKQRLAGSVFVLCASAAASMPLAAAQSTTIPVTSIVHDYDTAPQPNLLTFRSDDYNGSGQATYVSTSATCKSNCLNTYINTSTGAWRLDLFGQTLRTVCLTFQTSDGSTPVPPNGCYSAKVEIYSRCFDTSGNAISFLNIAAGTSQNNCGFGFDFSTSSKATYKLTMGQPGLTTPATGLATVSCNSGSPCASWTIVPNTIAAHPTIANLYRFSSGGSLTFIGQYYLTFRIDVTNP